MPEKVSYSIIKNVIEHCHLHRTFSFFGPKNFFFQQKWEARWSRKKDPDKPPQRHCEIIPSHPSHGTGAFLWHLALGCSNWLSVQHLGLGIISWWIFHWRLITGGSYANTRLRSGHQDAFFSGAFFAMFRLGPLDVPQRSSSLAQLKLKGL